MIALYVLATWGAFAFLTSLIVVALLIHAGAEPSLLDGRPLFSALDEHAHEPRAVERAREREDMQREIQDGIDDELFTMELNYYVFGETA